MDESKKPSLVALARRRDQVTEFLGQRFAEGVLDMDEYEDRVARAQQATDLVTLEDLVGDLEPPEAEAESQELAVRATADQALVASRPRKQRSVAILGGNERKGQWLVPETMQVYNLMGGTDLDFREAVLPPGVTEIKVRVLMGGVDIIVPPHVAVEADPVAILGGVDDNHETPPDIDANTPRLRISGVVIMGGVDITTRLPGETARQARKRRKAEKKRLRKSASAGALKAGATKQLPPAEDGE